ncbi:catechol 2,3-dioxygenase-like lactoylglutathione lyase family enzyme [Williamsia limnetica]|uniref:Catechol 2,3-dioxygenase-like lactoylglutathione lyase family enzyme n=1 Tax=Williamsia limnetica TaxID=882452 RepID=A0A318RFI4_WILLI|nr:VOC family protein [Williamsia limnetica]PYE13006.1 catechol 2,3-dioxygenase-like lactoylglutathione lyase family enzyme [Williamsia limnetica]
MPSTTPSPAPTATALAPDLLAHFVVKTARPTEMIDWYSTVLGARVVHEDGQIAFLTWDDESHRLALVKVPSVLRYLFPLARFRRKVYGVDHLAFTYTSLEPLLLNYERLAAAGIMPVWSINHGPTTSLYYEDPDGIRLEFQTENFNTPEATSEFFSSREFEANPIGITIDPSYLLERLRDGAPTESLLRRDAGVRPGTTPRVNKRAITLRTL